LCVNFQLTNNCFYSDLYEKNDSKTCDTVDQSSFQEGKIKATFAHVAQLPFATGFTGQRAKAKGAPTKGLQAQNPIGQAYKKTLMDQNLIHLRRLKVYN
jgi:hypothetical protein